MTAFLKAGSFRVACSLGQAGQDFAGEQKLGAIARASAAGLEGAPELAWQDSAPALGFGAFPWC